jgi:GH43 family beta-xylosidase
MILHEGFYYYCESRKSDRAIAIRKAKSIATISQDPGTIVWHTPETGPNSRSVWAPELHRINGRWYIYFAADNGHNVNHRMWVLEGESDNPLGPYHCRGQLQTEGWAIDGTVLRLEHEQLFFIWSGWPGYRNGRQNLYIAPMHDPLTIAGPRQLLTTPNKRWERIGMPICEGPQVLTRNGSIFIVYSASASWTTDYCLGLLSYRGGDLLNPLSWEKHGPVFQQTEQVWGVGHCSFVKSPCQTEDWIVYHSKSQKTKGWQDRDVHAKKFIWAANGLPDFGTPPPRAATVLAPLSKPVDPDAIIHLNVPIHFAIPEKPASLSDAHA